MSPHATTAAEYPPVLDSDGLGKLLHKTVSSIHADRSRAPHRLPPACTPPGTKKPLWLLPDVLTWLAQHRESAKQGTPAPQAPKEATPSPTIARRGAPNKGERIRAAELGVTIKELRAREAMGGAR